MADPIIDVSRSAYSITPGAGVPAGEEVDNVFDGGTSTKHSQFIAGPKYVRVVHESISQWRVTEINLTSANNLPERDPTEIILEYFNGTSWVDGPTLAVPAFVNRFQTVSILVPNNATGYRGHGIKVTNTTGQAAGGTGFQLAEIALRGLNTVPVPTTAPAAPGIGNETDVTGSSATFAITDNSDNERGFRLEVEFPPGAGNWAVPTGGNVAANSSSITISGLVAARNYRPRLIAVGDATNSTPTLGRAFWTASSVSGGAEIPPDTAVQTPASMTTGGVAFTLSNAAAADGFGVDKAFDANATTYHRMSGIVALGGVGVIGYEWADGKLRRLHSYAVVSSADTPARDPRTWTVQRRQNGVWTDVETRTDQVFASRGETKTFTLGNATDGSDAFRLRITARGDQAPSFDTLQIGELAFTGTEVQAPSVTSIAWTPAAASLTGAASQLLTLRDQASNPVVGAAVQIVAGGVGALSAVTTNAQGQVTYTGVEAGGSATVRASYNNGSADLTANATMTVAAQPTTPAVTSIVWQPATASITGATDLLLTLRDQAGNALPGATVQIQAGGVGSLSSSVTDASGQVVYTGVAAGGTANVRATFNNGQANLTATAAVTVAAPAPAPTITAISWTPATIALAGAASTTFTLVDQAGSPLSGAIVSIVAGGVGTLSSNATNAQGQITYTGVAAGGAATIRAVYTSDTASFTADAVVAVAPAPAPLTRAVDVVGLATPDGVLIANTVVRMVLLNGALSATVPSSGTAIAGYSQAVTDAAGNARFPGFPATAPALATAIITVPDGSAVAVLNVATVPQ